MAFSSSVFVSVSKLPPSYTDTGHVGLEGYPTPVWLHLDLTDYNYSGAISKSDHILRSSGLTTSTCLLRNTIQTVTVHLLLPLKFMFFPCAKYLHITPISPKVLAFQHQLCPKSHLNLSLQFKVPNLIIKSFKLIICETWDIIHPGAKFFSICELLTS